MRVLFAVTNGDRGGAQEHVRLLATTLRDRGLDVSTLVHGSSDLATRLRSQGIAVHHWASVVRNPHPIEDLRARRQLREAIAEVRPDVLHLHSSKAGVLGTGLLTPPSGVTIFTCHHAPFGPGRRWSHRALARPVEQLSVPHLQGVISVGARDLPMLQKLAPSVPMALVRNAVPTPTVAASSAPPPPVAAWIARMAHPKDPLQAVQAWERVVAEVPEARLVMCGGGPLSERVTSRIARSPARHAIDHRGPVPDLDEVLAESSIYLLTSQVEGGSTMATLEAMAAGLVPVISDVGDAYLYLHAGCGVVVARNSPRAVASAVVRLLRDPEELAAMGDRAAAFARSWTVDDMATATERFYGRVLRHHGCTDRG